jgi:serine/threonine protein kinase
MRGLLNAVSHLHANGIMHRDIKLSNVAWNEQSKEAILLDFDIACSFLQHFPRNYAGTTGKNTLNL